MLDLIAKEYFNAWANKNLELLSTLFDNNILLEDWETKLQGKENIINLNRNFFNTTNSIKLEIRKMAVNNNFVFSELYIQLNDNLELFVVDILEFKEDKIIKIKAFKG